MFCNSMESGDTFYLLKKKYFLVQYKHQKPIFFKSNSNKRNGSN